VVCKRTASRGLTISYQPGIVIPMFYVLLVYFGKISGVEGDKGREGRGTYNGDRNRGRIGEDKLYFFKLLTAAPVLC
jgi:hypothetical protein